jgi:hypothetical protein
MESPRGNMSFEIGGTGAGGPRAAADFREEYQIDPRGPFRGARPRSNQQQLQQQQPLPQQPILAEIQPMPEKMMRFNASSGVDGKALLHDLD